MSDALEQAREIYAAYIAALMRGESEYQAARFAKVAKQHIEEFVEQSRTDPMFISMFKDAVAKLDKPNAYTQEDDIVFLLSIVRGSKSEKYQLAARDRLVELLGHKPIESTGSQVVEARGMLDRLFNRGAKSE